MQCILVTGHIPSPQTPSFHSGVPFSPGFNSHFLSVSFPQLIEQMKEEIPILLSEVEQMCAELWNPREAVYKDVLLQRPKYVA